jgi:uncharacterized phage infection (PIP) family protein YhgE
MTTPLIPARFLLLVSHLVATLIVMQTKDAYIFSSLSLGDMTNYNQFNTSMIVAIALSLICFAIEFMGLLIGISLFRPVPNTIYIFSHFSGTIALSLFISGTWQSDMFWHIFIFTSLLPACVEGFILASQLRLNLLKWKS